MNYSRLNVTSTYNPGISVEAIYHLTCLHLTCLLNHDLVLILTQTFQNERDMTVFNVWSSTIKQLKTSVILAVYLHGITTLTVGYYSGKNKMYQRSLHSFPSHHGLFISTCNSYRIDLTSTMCSINTGVIICFTGCVAIYNRPQDIQ